MKIFLIVSIVLVALFGMFIMSDDYKRAAILGSEGFIETGSKFGIQIGMDREAAAKKLLADGFEGEELSPPATCNHRTYPEDQRVDLWYSRAKNGVICLASQEEKIVSIAWGIGGWEF